MAPCGPFHTAAHAVGGTTPVLCKTANCALQSRLGLGRGLSVGSRRYIALSFRTRDEDNAVFEAVPTRTTSNLLTIIDITQALSIFVVMAIQIGLIVRKHTASKVSPTMKMSKQITVPSDPLISLSEHQPLFLAWALACALFAKTFAPRAQVEVIINSELEIMFVWGFMGINFCRGFPQRLAADLFQSLEPRRMELQAKGIATQDLRQKADSVHIKESLRHVERQVSKMQSRVMICAEQFRTIRRATDESRMVTNEVLTQHGTALVEVQEQANSLQRVLSSLQDVVVKQIEVITPPIKSLNTRVRALEHELQQVKDNASQTGAGGGATHGDPGHESNHNQTAAQRCSPACTVESNRKSKLTVHPDWRNGTNGCESKASGSHVSDGISGAIQQEDLNADANDAAVVNSGGSSAASQTHEPAASMHQTMSHAPGVPGGFPGGDGRMMQISWRDTTCPIARRDAVVASACNSTHSNQAVPAAGEPPELQPSSWSGRVAQSSWQLGAGLASSQEPHWSQPERTAMTRRLIDLCRSYDTEAVVGYQPLQKGMLVAAAGAGRDDALAVGSRPVLPRRADQKWCQMGRALQPFAVANAVGAWGRMQHGAGDYILATAASMVPDGRQKLHVVDLAGQQMPPASQSLPPDAVARGGRDVQRDTVILLGQGYSDARVLAEHGLMTLLAFAVTSVVWAPPVV